ncbi:MAG TPA: hypothetical protein VG937_35920 [Polyangiaceae bacterium]|nr:hypothetical protein [Polyangiaceae bacterium]
MLEMGVSLPRLMSAALLSAVLSTSAVALAAEPTPTQIREAAEAFDRGREAYKTEDWVTAAEQFERADSLAASPTALEYAIRARDKAGQLDRAATLSVLVGKRYPEDANLGKIASEILDKSKSGLYELSVGCSEPCDLAIGGKIVPGAPDVQRTIYLPAGKQTIRAGFNGGRGDSTEVEAVVGGQGQVAFDAPASPGELAAAASATPEPAKPPPADAAPKKAHSGWSPAVFWVGAGVTAVMAGTTIWSGIDTLNNPGKDRVRSECKAGDTECSVYQDGLAHQRRTNVLIGVTAGVGVATALIGILATDWSGGEAAPPSDQPENPDEYPVARRHQRSVAHARIVPWVAVGNGALVGAEGRF